MLGKHISCVFFVMGARIGLILAYVDLDFFLSGCFVWGSTGVMVATWSCRPPSVLDTLRLSDGHTRYKAFRKFNINM